MHLVDIAWRSEEWRLALVLGALLYADWNGYDIKCFWLHRIISVFKKMHTLYSNDGAGELEWGFQNVAVWLSF